MSEADEGPFKLIGGRLCLDFVNTVGNWLDPARRRDNLADYGDLVAWAYHAGAIDETEVAALARVAGDRPVAAAATLERARALRQAIRDVVDAIAVGTAPPVAALDRLNGFVREEMAAVRLVPADPGPGFSLARGGDPAAPDRVLSPIVRSVVALLTSADLRRLRRCADDHCGWVFLDASRAGRRRWCDMADCGNVAKARRHRARRAAKG